MCVSMRVHGTHVPEAGGVVLLYSDGRHIKARLLLPGCSGKVLVAREAERHTDHGSAAEVLDLFEPVAGETGLLTCSTTRGAPVPSDSVLSVSHC